MTVLLKASDLVFSSQIRAALQLYISRCQCLDKRPVELFRRLLLNLLTRP